MKIKLAMVTPLPPDTSGIADYSAEILPYLAELADVDVYYVGDEPVPLTDVNISPFAELEERAGSYDAVVLQVGNCTTFAPVIKFAARHGADVAVMHDLNLSGVYGGTLIAQRQFGRFFGEILRQEGAAAFIKSGFRFLMCRQCPEPNDYRMNKSMIRSARRVIVHSDAAARELLVSHRDLEVDAVKMGIPFQEVPDDVAVRRAREELGLPANAFIFGSFGAVDERKRIHSVLQAFSELVKEHPDSLYCLVGSASPEWRDRINSLGIESNVIVTGRIDFEDFHRYLIAVDVCLNLRYPWLGEESGPLLRIMSFGKPVVVSDIGCFSAIPPDACLSVRAGDDDAEDVLSVMRSAITNPDAARKIGATGCDYVQREHSLEGAAKGYMGSIEKAIAGRK